MTNIPTIQTLFDNLKDGLEAEFGIQTNPLIKAFLIGLCGVLSGMLWLIYLAIGDVQKNIWYDTADYDNLLRYGKTILGRYPNAATPGEYTATVTGTTGAVIPGTTVFKADDTADAPGALYQIKGGDYTLPGSSGTITIVALAGGLASRLAVGNTLTSTTPIVNVQSKITVASEAVVPIDAEFTEEYRSNIDEKVRLKPGSWNAADYRIVGLNVTGVGQVYAYANNGNSAVMDVYLQGTTAVASPGPSVSPTVLSNYQTALEAVLPLDVWDVNYAASPIKNVAVTITMGTFPAFTTAQKALILSALTDFINSVHPFIDAIDDIANRNDVLATYNISSVISAAVPGYGFSSVAFTVAGTPTTYWQADNGEIPFMNSITYL